jgi:WD40 repeat protein
MGITEGLCIYKPFRLSLAPKHLLGNLALKKPRSLFLNYRVVFSPDGRTIASGGKDCSIKLWDSSNGQERQHLSGHANSVCSLAFSSDGKQIASASHDGTIKLWQPESGKMFDNLVGHTGEVLAVNFSPDDSTLASSGADGTVRLWNTADTKQPTILMGHEDYWLTSLAFSPDGRVDEPISFNNIITIKLWDVRNAKEKAVLKKHTFPVTTMAFSPDGSKPIHPVFRGLHLFL